MAAKEDSGSDSEGDIYNAALIKPGYDAIEQDEHWADSMPFPVFDDSVYDASARTARADALCHFGGLVAGLPACLTKFVPATALQFMLYSEIMRQVQTRARKAT